MPEQETVTAAPLLIGKITPPRNDPTEVRYPLGHFPVGTVNVAVAEGTADVEGVRYPANRPIAFAPARPTVRAAPPDRGLADALVAPTLISVTVESNSAAVVRSTL
jgi:hypothetical protein